MNCAICKFCKKVVGEYQCRKKSPNNFQFGNSSEGMDVITSWPKVRPGDFCGDFQPRLRIADGDAA